MTTAIGDIVFDFSAEGDANPFTTSGITAIEPMQVLSGLYKAGTVGVLRRAYCTTAPDENIISSEVEMGYTSAVFSDVTGPALIKSNGEGFYIRMNGDQMWLRKVDSAGSTSELTDADYTYTSYVVGDRFRISLNVSTGDLTTYKNDVLQATKSSDTYTQGGANGDFYAGVLSDLQDSGAGGVVSFAVDGISSTGPEITSTTDPIVWNGPMSVTVSEEVYVTPEIKIEIGSRRVYFDASTDDDLTFYSPGDVDMGDLPPKGTATVTLLVDEETSVDPVEVEMEPPSGYSATVGVSVVDEDAVPHTGTLASGDIILLSDSPNTVISSDFSTISQIVPGPFTARVWTASTELWDEATIFPYNPGGGDSTGIVKDIIKNIVKSIIK